MLGLVILYMLSDPLDLLKSEDATEADAQERWVKRVSHQQVTFSLLGVPLGRDKESK